MVEWQIRAASALQPKLLKSISPIVADWQKQVECLVGIEGFDHYVGGTTSSLDSSDEMLGQCVFAADFGAGDCKQWVLGLVLCLMRA